MMGEIQKMREIQNKLCEILGRIQTPLCKCEIGTCKGDPNGASCKVWIANQMIACMNGLQASNGDKRGDAAQAQATATNTGMVSASQIAAILDTLESARSQPYFLAVVDESILRLRQLHHA